MKSPRDFYDKEANRYDKLRLHVFDGNVINDVTQKKILIELFDGGKNVLEIAPGTGRITEQLLSKTSKKITCVDISGEMLKELSKKSWYESTKMDLIHSNILEYHPSETFDFILFINAASHMENFEDIFSHVVKLLGKRGKLVFNVPNVNSIYWPVARLINYRQKSILRNVYTRWYTESEIKTLSERHNVKINQIKGMLHIPLGCPKFLIPIVKPFLLTKYKLFHSQLFFMIEHK